MPYLAQTNLETDCNTTYKPLLFLVNEQYYMYFMAINSNF